MNFTKMAQPTIPRGLLHTMYELKAAGGYDQTKGGQWVPGTGRYPRYNPLPA